MDPAVRLQADDCGTSCAHAGTAGQYRKALDALAAKCTDSRDPAVLKGGLASAIIRARKLLASKGIRYSDLALLQGVAATIPAGTRVKCVDQIGTYVATLEPVTPPASPSRTAQ